MRNAPAFDIDLPSQPAWRATVAGSMALSASVIAAWWCLPVPELDPRLRFALGALALLVVALAWTVAGTRPCRLRWDGADWWLGPVVVDDGGVTQALAMQTGTLRVMVDLGGLLLLRFDAGGSSWRRSRWLPVQRKGLESRWHGLRCAVYSVRPSSPAGETLPSTPTRVGPPQ